MTHRNRWDEWDHWDQRPIRPAAYLTVALIVAFAFALIAVAATSSPEPSPEARVYDGIGPTVLVAEIGTTGGDGIVA